MMKYLTHYLAVFILSMAFSLSGQDVEISIDHPERVNAGENFTVTVTIKKGSLTDYSRFSQDLPLGLAATNVSSPNADFSFDEQRVRIIWLKLPEANEIKVSYLVSVDARLKGKFSLGGVFAYVVGDERKFLNFDQRKPITIVPSNSVDQSLIVDIQNFRGGKAPVTPPTVSRGVGPFAMAVRQRPALLNTGGYLVHLLIDNPPGSKYAKVEESIPSGYQFEEVNSNEGIVSHAASTVKFIWMKMPEQSEFEVIYRLVPKQGEPQGNMLIEGLLTYTDGNQNKEAGIVEMDVSLDNLSATQKRDLLATGKVPQATRTTPPVQTVSRPPASSADMGSASGRVIANTKVLDRGTGVYFRIQLTANMNAFDATTFYREAGVDREVFVEQHNGYYKYTVGPFQTYSQAMSYKENVENIQEVQGAFVVGYNNGNRVSAGSLR
ncbi:MAG: hypothetical protein GQ579_05130 [Bacteroidales bacterium]|nr:hypothetical protein [Bacteroidales bacterium]